MAKAWLVTHPETKFDEEGRVHGNKDPELSSRGRIHAKQIAATFKGKKVSKIHSSPRKRAQELAAMISKHTGAPVSVDHDLEPWDLGPKLSGSKTASMRPLLDFFSNRPNRAIPGGEAKNHVLGRYGRFMKKVGPNDVVVGHSQHSLALNHVRKGGDASKVPMFGGHSGEVRQIEV